MRVEINEEQFVYLMKEKTNFSDEALKSLFYYYEEFDHIDLDPVGFRCKWIESTEEELMNDYDYLLEEGKDIDDLLEEIGDRTYLEGLSNGNYLVQNF